MAQPFRRAWDILKQGPYDHQNPNERKWTTRPTDWPPYEPQERPPSPNPYGGERPGDSQRNPGPYDHSQAITGKYYTSSRISAIQTQIQQLEAELQRLLQMQSGGGGHPWER